MIELTERAAYVEERKLCAMRQYVRAVEGLYAQGLPDKLTRTKSAALIRRERSAIKRAVMPYVELRESQTSKWKDYAIQETDAILTVASRKDRCGYHNWYIRRKAERELLASHYSEGHWTAVADGLIAYWRFGVSA